MTFNMWWDLSLYIYYKFTAKFNSENLVTICRNYVQ